MPKRSRSGRIRVRFTQDVQHNAPVDIKEECVDEEVNIKTEPVENDYEFDPMQFPPTKTVIVNENDPNRVSVEDEFGLVSQLDIVKTEVDVDETTVNAFRDELMTMSIDAAPKSLKRKRSEEENTKKKKKEKGEEKQEKKVKKLKNEVQQNKQKKTPKSAEPMELLVDGQKMVKCPFCEKITTTRNRSLLKDHIRLHTGETPFKCAYCDQRFARVYSLKSHIEYHHKKDKFKCHLCKSVFFEADEFDEHELKCVKRRTFECHLCRLPMKRVFMHLAKHHMRMAHTGEETFGCKHCPEKFVSKTGLSSHIRRSHPETVPFKCSKCRITFQEQVRWKKHERHCLTRRRFECHLCQYAYAKLTEGGLKMHMRKHTGIKPHQCHLCQKFFPRTEALAQHLQRHRETFQLKCFMCHRRFLTDDELQKHQQNCRKRRYECHLCGFTKYGISFSSFKRHMYAHTGEKHIKCHDCTETFSTSTSLTRHVFEMHPKQLTTICPNCCHRFNSKNERDAHQSKCMKRRIECYICKRSSKKMKKLQNHMSIKHSGVQRFQCKLCPKKFQIKTNLTIHMKSHTKIGLVKCQYCSKTFADMKYKKKHEFQCKKVYECWLCKKTFPSFAILNGKHMRTHLGATPYDCRHCTRSSGSVRCYGLHVLGQHLHLYKFQCNICKRIIVKKSDLQTHQKSCMKPIRKSQGVIYFKCSLCQQGLARLPEVKQHILTGECKNHPKKKR